MLSIRKPAQSALFAMLCTAFLLTPAVRADGGRDILKIVPDDAWAFVIFRSLDTIDDSAKLLRDAGVDVAISTLGDGARARTLTEDELEAWVGKRAQTGRLPPSGSPRTSRFG